MFQRAFVSVRVSARPDVGVGKLAHLPEQPQAMRGRDLQIALEFAFLDDPLMRLVGALDAILTVIAFGRKQLCDLVNSACRATTIDPRVEHALADLEPVIAQANIRREDKDLRPAVETDQKRRYFWVHAEFYHGQRPERDCFECGLDAHGKERTASLEGAPSDAEHGIGLGCAPK